MIQSESNSFTSCGKTSVNEIWKAWVKGGKRIGQDNMEESYSTPFGRPQMMGKAWGEEAE